jgi:sugar lactone lactonase YvrE
MKTVKSTLTAHFTLLCLSVIPVRSGTQSIYEPHTFTTLAGSASYGSSDGLGSAARFNSPSGVAVDTAGNVYVADQSNNTIRKVTSAGLVTTLAGLAHFDSNGNPVGGSADGTGSAARFNGPNSVAVDNTGTLYVADTGNNTIRKVTPAGVVTTLAGSAGQYGFADGAGSAARFALPYGVAVDTAGNVYVADHDTIRKVSPAGIVTTLAGLVGPGDLNGSADGIRSAARFFNPQAVAVDSAGNVFVADTRNNTIRKVTQAGVVTTLAAGFVFPSGVAVDSAGNLYVADRGSHTIRQVTPAGVVTTLAGLADTRSIGGSADGSGNAAQFSYPSGVAVDSSGNVYVADQGNNTVRKVTLAGVVTTLAGWASLGSADGIGGAAQFYYPQGVVVDNAGNIYVADMGNQTIRKVTPAGVVTTLAGLAGNPGSTDGTGSNARFGSNGFYSGPSAVAVDSTGTIYVADTANSTIRKVTAMGSVGTLAGLAGYSGNMDGAGPEARFYYPQGVAVDGTGNLYVADTFNNTIRKVNSLGVVSTLAGLAESPGSADGIGSDARFNLPAAVALDGVGNLFIADSRNHTIRRLTPEGRVTTLAGLPGAYGATDGTGSEARFAGSDITLVLSPTGLAVDRAGNLYAADSISNTIRKVTAAGSNWCVTTVAGFPSMGGTADGTGSAARFRFGSRGLTGMAVDDSGTIYVADTVNNTIRKGYPAVAISSYGQGSGPPGTQFGLSLTGRAGQPVVLEVSSDLRTWWPVWTNTLTGKLRFEDPVIDLSTPRFYRAYTPRLP